MDIDEQVIEPVEDSIRNDLEKAFADAEPKQEDIEHEIKADKPRDEAGKFAKKSDERSALPPLPPEKLAEAPAAWKAADRIAEWEAMTPKQREVLQRREEEVVAGFSKLDEERNFGKSLKEVITPYLPIITAEGGTPATAVKELLNTAYILRTAPAAQKTALFHQLAQQYGVDLSQPNTNPTVQPGNEIALLKQEIAQLRQQAQQQPEVFRQQQESLAIKSQIDAFAADPKNVHYEKLKPVMASLLQGGQAKDMQDAYDKASWADPDIRSALQSDQHRASETQRIADIKAKAETARKKAVSVKGYPSVNPVANGSANNSIREDLEAAFELHA